VQDAPHLIPVAVFPHDARFRCLEVILTDRHQLTWSNIEQWTGPPQSHSGAQPGTSHFFPLLEQQPLHAKPNPRQFDSSAPRSQ